MRLKALIPFKSKLSSSCHRLASLFRFKLKKLRIVRSLFPLPCHVKLEKPTSSTRCLPTSFSSFRKKNRKQKRMMNERKSFSDAKLLDSPLTPAKKKLFPSPVTPASMRTTTRKPSSLIRESSGNDAVDDSCRSFENYLIHMIVEEGKVEDLMDIEELLYCWRNLKSPVFVDLVSRFYGELCRDLFSSDDDKEDDIVSHTGQK